MERAGQDRRRFLGTLAAAGAGSLLPAHALLGQAPAGAPRRIDIHQHFVSPSFYTTLNAKNTTSPVPGLAAWKGYSPARAVEELDRGRTITRRLRWRCRSRGGR